MTKNLAEGLKASLMVAMVAALGACATTSKQPAQAPATEAPAATSPASQTPAAPAAEAPTQSSMTSSYEVARGDCLWTIAGQSQIYGNPYEWPLIYKANSDKITHGPDLIFPGQNFSIDRSAGSADIDAATHYAKTRGAWKLGVEGSADKRFLAGK